MAADFFVFYVVFLCIPSALCTLRSWVTYILTTQLYLNSAGHDIQIYNTGITCDTDWFACLSVTQIRQLDICTSSLLTWAKHEWVCAQQHHRYNILWWVGALVQYQWNTRRSCSIYSKNKPTNKKSKHSVDSHSLQKKVTMTFFFFLNLPVIINVGHSHWAWKYQWVVKISELSQCRALIIFLNYLYCLGKKCLLKVPPTHTQTHIHTPSTFFSPKAENAPSISNSGFTFNLGHLKSKCPRSQIFKRKTTYSFIKVIVSLKLLVVWKCCKLASPLVKHLNRLWKKSHFFFFFSSEN